MNKKYTLDPRLLHVHATPVVEYEKARRIAERYNLETPPMMSIYEAQACSSCRTLAAVTEKLDRLRNPPPRKRGSRVRAATLVAIAAGLGSRR